ncbi:hypothetical protein [Pseudomonas fluorescens]|uniref:Uncharacterized protein n=1 Tax=Pseudomonas fluorescens TaxID=294 RepID=A0A5E6QG19_PSEFL|nr:hypothetical protein [Pseudomonas fluorescens]VVM54208.1 hypothetical protein PS624_00945 [Pseudomonas fluorescens]
MKEHCSATEFTLTYLKLLEQHLNVTWNDDGLPICVIDWISDESIEALRGDLIRLMTSDLEREARKATATYGLDHVQTVGFGLAPNFDEFVKLGLIYGERVVLWDVIHSRILAGSNSVDRKSLIGQIACELLMLRGTVQQGGVVLLAHPIVWSTDAADIDKELRGSSPVPAASLGLAMAFAAIQEGIQLHPYTLLTDASRQELTPAIQAADHELFSRESFSFQQCLTTVLQDDRVAFVKDVPTEEFYGVISRHDKLRQRIRQHFQPALTGLSPQQLSLENETLVGDLFELFGQRDADLKEYIADAADASFAFVTASLSATVLGQPLLPSLAALGPPAMALATAVRKWARKPEKSVIIQAFQALEKSAAENRMIDPADVQNRLNSVKKGLASLKDHYWEFMNCDWTEHRHDYLISVSPEIAKAILALLTPDDINRIVNARRFQADYIGDYLEYISELDEAIHWVHLEKTFDSEDGFLLYDGDAHVRAMEERQIPMSLWHLLLDNLSALACDMDLTGVIHYQTEQADDRGEKRNALITLASSMDEEDNAVLTELVRQGNDGHMPEWMSIALSARASAIVG